MSRAAMNGRTDRHGGSTLVTVVVLLTIVLLVQVFQHVFSSRVTDQAFRNVHGRTAHDLAGTACQEARAIIERRLADPARPEFAAVRNPSSIGPGVKVAIDVPLAELEETNRLMTAEHNGAYRMLAVVAHVAPRLAISDAEPVEYEGPLTVTATVQSVADPGIVRKVGRTWLVKLVHIAPAGPLAQVTALVRHPADILRGRFDAPELARKFMRENLPGLIRDLTTTIADIERQANAATDAQMKDALQKIRGIYAPLVEGADGGRIGQVFQPLDAKYRALPELPAAGTDFLLLNSTEKLGIAELDIQGDLGALVPQYVDMSQKLDALGQQVRNLRTADAAAQAMHQRYVNDTAAIAEQMGKIAGRYLRLREKFAVLKTGEAGFDKLDRAYGLIDPVARLQQFPEYPKFDKRVCFVAEERTASGSANEAISRLAARLERDDGGVQGVLYLDNPATTLTLSGVHKGRWTLVVSGSLVIDNLRRGDPAKDLFTIVQTSSTAGKCELAGTVDATVVTHGRRLRVAAGTQVLGGLYVDDMDPAAAIEPVLDGPEEVKRDPAREAGDPDRRRHALISPWTRSTSVDRNP